MAKKYLIINLGSTSKRYSVYQNNKEIFNFYFDKLNKSSASYILFSNHVIESKSEIQTAGIRIVAPGTFFLKNRVINQRYINELKKVEKIAPLHIIPVLQEIKVLKKEFPQIKLFGISDSAFHKTLSENACCYSIKKSFADKFGIRRYGYHGISFQSVLNKIKPLRKKIIICHLGGGSSIAAVKNGKSFDTTMGFTPLGGLFGGTRIGDICPGAVIWLGNKLKLNNNQLNNYLNNECGFKGMGGSSDMQELLKLEKSHDKNKAEMAKLTINSFVYRIKKYIGAYASAMNGLDLLVFTGKMGEDSSIIRKRICENLDALGIILDSKKNLQIKEGSMDSKKSKVKIEVIMTSEMDQIYRETKVLCYVK